MLGFGVASMRGHWAEQAYAEEQRFCTRGAPAAPGSPSGSLCPSSSAQYRPPTRSSASISSRATPPRTRSSTAPGYWRCWIGSARRSRSRCRRTSAGANRLAGSMPCGRWRRSPCSPATSTRPPDICARSATGSKRTRTTASFPLGLGGSGSLPARALQRCRATRAARAGTGTRAGRGPAEPVAAGAGAGVFRRCGARAGRAASPRSRRDHHRAHRRPSVAGRRTLRPGRGPRGGRAPPGERRSAQRGPRPLHRKQVIPLARRVRGG